MQTCRITTKETIFQIASEIATSSPIIQADFFYFLAMFDKDHYIQSIKQMDHTCKEFFKTMAKLIEEQEKGDI